MRFFLLFAYIMVQLAVLPIFERSLLLGAIDDFVYFTLIFSVLIGIRHTRLFWPSVMLFVILIGVYTALLVYETSLAVMVAVNFCAAAFMVIAIVSILSFILQQDSITLDGVAGGLCVYLLIGAVFMSIFVNVELLAPGSFDFGIHGAHPQPLELYDLLYFYSFVSLLTIGYGDILPLSNLAQTLSVLEGVIGQFYLVFCVAVLVGLYVQARQVGTPRERP